MKIKIEPNKTIPNQNWRSQNNFGGKQIFVEKKVLVTNKCVKNIFGNKKFLVKKMLLEKNICGGKKIFGQKTFWSKKFWIKKNVRSKKCLILLFNWVWKNFDPKRFKVLKIWGPN